MLRLIFSRHLTRSSVQKKLTSMSIVEGEDVEKWSGSNRILRFDI
jgi:hypothetical protein